VTRDLQKFDPKNGLKRNFEAMIKDYASFSVRVYFKNHVFFSFSLTLLKWLSEAKLKARSEASRQKIILKDF